MLMVHDVNELPNKVQIGAIAYTINEITMAIDADKPTRTVGQILVDSAVIDIAADLHPQVKIHTLWHETFHGILNAAGQDDQPEHIIDALAHGVVMLLRDNPNLIPLTTLSGAVGILPEFIRIGALAYEVKEITDLHDVDKDGRKRWLHGHILWRECRIEIEEKQAHERKVACLWHEAVHGMLEYAGISDESEQMVIAVAYGLVRLIRDNPALVSATIGEHDGRNGTE